MPIYVIIDVWIGILSGKIDWFSAAFIKESISVRQKVTECKIVIALNFLEGPAVKLGFCAVLDSKIAYIDRSYRGLDGYQGSVVNSISIIISKKEIINRTRSLYGYRAVCRQIKCIYMVTVEIKRKLTLDITAICVL